MASSLDALADLLSRLHIVGDPIFILKELRTAVLTLPADELEVVAKNISLAPVFDSLNATDKEQISLACDLLTSILSSLTPNTILPQFQAELYRGLMHPNPLVKEMVLKQIKRCAPYYHLLENSKETLVAIVQLCADDDLAIAKHATETLGEMSKTRQGLNLIFRNTIIRVIKENMNINDTVRFRMYEVIVKISKESVDGLNMCVESGLLNYFLNEYRQDDILLQLNCLELMSELAMVDHSLRYLENQGIILHLEKVLQEESVNSSGGFILPGLIKFFGNMGYIRPKEVCDRYRPFVNILFKYIESNEPNLFTIAMETIAMLGASVEGKLTLEKQNVLVQHCMQKLGSVISNSPSDLRVKALNATTLIMDLKVEDQTTELLALTEMWFSQLSKQPMQLIISLCRQPFIDLRCAALDCVRSIAQQPWGQKKLSRYPGFFEYILDRNTEPDKEGKELKFAIISTLVQSPTAEELFGSEAVKKLKDFYNEGPFFVTAQAEVATDGAS